MNRRSFFTFMGGCAPATLLAHAADADTPVLDKRLLAEREEMFTAFSAAEPQQARHHPDWNIFGLVQLTSTMRWIPSWLQHSFYYAMVTNDPFWTRTAVKAGWRLADDKVSTWWDTGLECVLFAKPRAET